MAIVNNPSGDRNHMEFVRYWRPAGSQSVVWLQEMKTQRMYYLLHWGNDLYLPVADGDHIGIGVYNGRDTWMAYPAYVEAKNLWDGGQGEPEECDTEHMWELKPTTQMVMDAIMNPGAQRGRPLIVTESGMGFGIGEATFHTTQWRGQIRLYERIQFGGGYQRQRNTNEGTGTRGGGFYGETLESFGPTRSFDDEIMRGAKSLGPDDLGTTRGVSRGRATIGAGDEEYRQHVNTGVTYQRNSQPVVFLRMEYRSDLQNMLNRAWGTSWDWFWSMPLASHWWEEPWNWRPGAGPTAPNIPTAPRPHTGRH